LGDDNIGEDRQSARPATLQTGEKDEYNRRWNETETADSILLQLGRQRQLLNNVLGNTAMIGNTALLIGQKAKTPHL
jgi:hypothetical protein